MRAAVIAIGLIVGYISINALPAVAQSKLHILLSPAEASAYRACLFEAWIQDYCHGNSSRPTASYERVYLGCVSANRGGRFPLVGRNWLNTDDYCWNAAKKFR
jgi:hypothetical protein